MGYKHSEKRAPENVEFGAGRVATAIRDMGHHEYVRVVINFWGKSKFSQQRVVHGLTSGGLNIVSFTEATPDYENITPRMLRKRSEISTIEHLASCVMPEILQSYILTNSDF